MRDGKKELSMIGTINVVNRISKKVSYCQEVALIVENESRIVHITQSICSIQSTIEKDKTKKIFEVKRE